MKKGVRKSQETREKDLLERVKDLELRLSEAEETLRAIRSGEVDALAIETATGIQIFTLKGADYPYRMIVENISEGAVTLLSDGTITYANQRFADMLGLALEKIIGSLFHYFVHESGKGGLLRLIGDSLAGKQKDEFLLSTARGDYLPVAVSTNPLTVEEQMSVSMVITDLTEQKKREDRLDFEVRKRTAELEDVTAELKVQNLELRSIQQQLEEDQRDAAEIDAIFTAQNDTVLLYDREMNVRRVNPSFLAIYGFDPVGLNVKDLVGHVSARWLDGRPFILEEQPTPRALQGEKVTGALFMVTRADGTDTVVETSSAPIRAGNRITGSVTVWHDISDLKQAEEALRESEARFRLLSSTAGRLLGADDPQAITEDICRDVMAHLDCQVFFNYLLDENVGRLRLNACAGIPEEDARAIEWLDYGVAVCGCVARDRVRIIADDIFHTPDVRTELVKSFGIQAYCCHPLMAQDRLIGTLSFGTKTRPRFTPEEVELMRMVTDQVAVAMQRKQAEIDLQKAKDDLERRIEERTKELKAASLYTRRLIETHLDPLVTISANGKITDVNAAAELVTGLSRRELLGSDFFDYATEPEKARAGYEKVFQEGSVRDYPLAIRHRSGRITEVLYNASTYTNEEGNIQGVFAAARDMTELRQAQNELRKSYENLERRVEERTVDLKKSTEQLIAANKELESFSYSVSHDLRAPLRAIDGYARMILKKEWGKFDEDTARKFNAIRSNAHMMGQLIDDLLSFSRLSKKQMSTSKLDMESIIMDVWKELQIINTRQNVTLTIHNIPPGYGDRTLIKQVYFNLLSNAVKFTKHMDTAHIEAGSSLENDGNIYYIKDNGVGFDMAYYDKLFGIFQRLHSADDFEGTGVGLATVQRIVHRHGGRVWAEGKVNEGATFYFTLPGKEV